MSKPSKTPTRRATNKSVIPSSQALFRVVLLALVSATGALLLFYMFAGRILKSTGQQREIYYIILLLVGLIPSLVLFGVLRRSTALYRGSAVGHHLELSGPAALFMLVIAGGIYAVPFNSTFDLTVFARNAGTLSPGIQNGSISLTVASLHQRVPFNAEGEAIFKQLPRRYLGDSAILVPRVEGYEQESRRVLLTETINLELKQKQPERSRLNGTIVPVPETPSLYWLVVEGQQDTIHPDKFGRFSVAVRGEPGDPVRLRIYRDTQIVYDNYLTPPGPVTLSISEGGN